MKKNYVIGIPRSLLYHTYGDLWLDFFDELNVNYILSPKSNKKILNRGMKLTSSEACLSLKLFMGHVDYLKDKCDYIFIPRISKIKKNEVVCTNFNALYDLTRNAFPNLKIIHYNIDYKRHNSEYKDFVKIGNFLGKNSYESTMSYINALKKQNKLKKIKKEHEKIILKNNNKKILVIGHSYNIFDDLIGKEITDLLKKENIGILLNAEVDVNKLYKKIMPTLYFSYHKKLISSIVKYKNKVNGIILVTTFPCGTDSLVFDMVKRKIKNIPIITIVFDDLTSNTGLVTRIESFIDIIKENNNE